MIRVPPRRNGVDADGAAIHPALRLGGPSAQPLRGVDVTRTAAQIQRPVRRSPGCALLGGAKQPGLGMPAGHNRSEYVSQLASRGSSPG